MPMRMSVLDSHLFTVFLFRLCVYMYHLFFLYADTMGAYSSGELAEKFSEAGVDANF